MITDYTRIPIRSVFPVGIDAFEDFHRMARPLGDFVWPESQR